jgi:diguanylate cyclase (GGDEF)-like protein
MGMLLRVLIIEDTDENALAYVNVLRQGGYDPVFERVDNSANMASALSRQNWDVIIAQHNLAQFDATSALMLAKKLEVDVPFIIISGSFGEDAAVAAMKMGAHDYIMRDNLTRLVPAIDRELREAEVRRQRKRAEETLQHQAHYDWLTDLPNRIMFHDRLTLAVAHAERQRKMLAVLFVDLDRFKTIVDTLGHAVGDQVLRGVAERLSSVLSDSDTLARLGGDEFVVLLPDVGRADRAAKLAQQMLEVLKEPFHFGNNELHITTSIGISLYPYDGEDADALLKNSDTALYRAKEQGRNNYQLYTPAMNARAFERLAMENSLRRALDKEEFLLHYQPIIDMASGQIVGMEALVRWQHPDLGLVFPAEFISLAEETGLIVPLGEWVLRKACAQSQAWQKAGLPPLMLSVNLSARQFQHHDLVDIISRVLKETELNPRCLELEITETIAMQNADYTIVLLRELKDRGINISLDDFGTGYSSLSYLKKFPISTLKIDQSFVRDIDSDPSDAAIANAIIVLAHSLNLIVVAEGVETIEQLKFLKQSHCDKLQGYLFSGPVNEPAFEALLRQNLQNPVSIPA